MLALQPIARTREHASHRPGLELVDDALDTDVRAEGEIHDADEDDDGVDDHADFVGDAAAFLAGFDVGAAHAEVGDGPEDEAEPAVEEGRHDGEDWVLKPY